MNFAFPQEQVIKTVFQGLADAARRLHAQHLSRLHRRVLDSYKYDLDKAKALLEKAGLASASRRASPTMPAIPVQEPIAILYQTALREIGVELELKKVPAGYVLQRRHRAQAADDLLRRQPVVPGPRLLDDALFRLARAT